MLTDTIFILCILAIYTDFPDNAVSFADRFGKHVTKISLNKCTSEYLMRISDFIYIRSDITFL